ncbi:MAG: hypothetical protein WC241_00620 [Candidatus Paceibacterota bacterium]|jgi:hypothetical protein
MGFGDKIKIAALGVVLSGSALEAQETSKSSIPDAHNIQTEKSTNYQEIYSDKIYQRNEKIIELKNSLDKKAGEVHKIALQIKNQIDNPFSPNDQKLKDLMIVKFHNIDIANEYLIKITDAENIGLLEIFNDRSSKEFQSLRELNKPLMEYKSIIDKIKELYQEIYGLASSADANTPIAPDQIPTTIAGTNDTHSKVQFVQQNKNKETFGPSLKNEIHLKKQTTKVGEILRDLSYNLGKFGEGLKGMIVNENGCYICPPPGGEITR